MRIVFSILVLFMALPAMAGEEQKGIAVEGTYAYATSELQKNGAVFMIVTNHGPNDNKIIGASADVSEKIELHTHDMDGDMMMMREVEAYNLPVGEAVTLEPMGHHIMLMGLKAPLKAGESFPLTLTLEESGPIEIDVQIKTLGDT